MMKKILIKMIPWLVVLLTATFCFGLLMNQKTIKKEIKSQNVTIIHYQRVVDSLLNIKTYNVSAFINDNSKSNLKYNKGEIFFAKEYTVYLRQANDSIVLNILK